MAEEELTVRGLTGVDMSLRIAGPGTRSFAFLIDWQIRLLVALALILVATMWRLIPGPSPWMHSVSVASFAVAPLVYFLYHPVLELLMQGSTPGKRRAGARIVTVEGAIPTAGSLLMRNLFRLIDALPAFYVVGLGCCLLTDKRVRLGDLVAGTVLVLEEADVSKGLARLGAAMQRSGLPLETLRLIHDLLDRWRDLEEGSRTRLARDLLARLDPGFDAARDSALSDPTLRARLETLVGARSGS